MKKLPSIAYDLAKKYRISLWDGVDVPQDPDNPPGTTSFGCCKKMCAKGTDIVIMVMIFISDALKGDERTLVFFHEMGHALNEDDKPGCGMTPFQREIAAWNFGLSLAKDHGINFDDDALQKVGSCLAIDGGYDLRNWKYVPVPEDCWWGKSHVKS